MVRVTAGGFNVPLPQHAECHSPDEPMNLHHWTSLAQLGGKRRRLSQNLSRKQILAVFVCGLVAHNGFILKSA
jgi:hypothetical protein